MCFQTWYFYSALWNHRESIRFILFFLYLCWSILWFPELINQRKARKAARLFQARVLCLTDLFRRTFLLFVVPVPSWLLTSKDWTNCLMQRLCLTHTSMDAGHCRTYWSSGVAGVLAFGKGTLYLKHRVKAERTLNPSRKNMLHKGGVGIAKGKESLAPPLFTGVWHRLRRKTEWGQACTPRTYKP